MADVNKTKLQLRSGLTTNGDKSPSPATKLLINHGKPNFTIQRAHKTQNGNAANVTSPTPAVTVGNTRNNNNNNNNNEFVVKSTMFNGVFKPSNISAAAKQTLPQNGNTISRNGNSDNEAAKVVLRRPQAVQVERREREDDENVPEFIRRQRRIQERLANQNILDFENRRSGYFTQVMITPTSPNRQSFVETMASPAVKPGLEMPAPAVQPENNTTEAILEKQDAEQPSQEQEQQPQGEIANGEEAACLEPVDLNESQAATANGEESVNLNGSQQEQAEIANDNKDVCLEPHLNGSQIEEEEVAKAIEEVNKAVEGEDDDRTELEDHNKDSLQETQQENELEVDVIASKTEEEAQENGQDEATNASLTAIANEEVETKSNGHAEEIQHANGLPDAQALDAAVTISHVNGINGPCIPAPDPSGEKGVNYETKTVVSFSQELGAGDNKYPDSVKVITDNEVSAADSELKELSKLKFEIKADNRDIEVKPVLVQETA